MVTASEFVLRVLILLLRRHDSRRVHCTSKLLVLMRGAALEVARLLHLLMFTYSRLSTLQRLLLFCLPLRALLLFHLPLQYRDNWQLLVLQIGLGLILRSQQLTLCCLSLLAHRMLRDLALGALLR